ncbi:hypothetical protein VPH35_021322 [Triticum aestivum]
MAQACRTTPLRLPHQLHQATPCMLTSCRDASTTHSRYAVDFPLLTISKKLSDQDWFFTVAISLLIPIISLFLFVIVSLSIIFLFCYFLGWLRVHVSLDFAAGRTYFYYRMKVYALMFHPVFDLSSPCCILISSPSLTVVHQDVPYPCLFICIQPSDHCIFIRLQRSILHCMTRSCAQDFYG